MLLSGLLMMPAASFAAEDDSAGLEEAIKAVRSIIEVPEERSEFSYYLNSSVDGYKVWMLEWTDNESGYTNVAVDSEGTISEYGSYDWSRENQGLGSVSLSEGLKIAESFMETVLPEGLRGEYRLESQYSGFGSLEYSFRFYANDIPINFVNASVSIDKFTGEVRNYSLDAGKEERKLAEELIAGEKGKPVLSFEEAKAAFLEQVGIDLAYHTSYDYEENTRSREVFAGYSLNSKGLYVDAATGDIVSRYYAYRFGGAGSTAKNEAASFVTEDAAAAEEDGGYRLSPEEQAKVDKLEGALSQSEAAAEIVRQVPGISKDDLVRSSSIRQDYFDKEKYTISVRFDNATASIDAFTGDLWNFNIFNYESSNTGGINKDKAKAAAEKYIKGLAGDKFSEVEYNDGSKDGPILFRSENAKEDPTYQPYAYYISYDRIVNGIRYDENGFHATVNRKDGEIVSYSKEWFDDVEFPDVSKAAGASKAFDTFNKEGSFKLMYQITAEDKATLVYGWDGVKGAYVSLDGSELLNYAGKPYTEAAEQLAAYDDVEGRWYEDVANKLLDNGYFITEGEKSFNGNAKISQLDFLHFLYTRERGYYSSDDEFYKYVVRDIVKEEERNPSAELTRADAAKFIVRYLGLEKAGALSGIFAKDLYTDKVPEGYEGYAALAKGLGIMQGDTLGAFNGANTITRAEAAVVIYNALS